MAEHSALFVTTVASTLEAFLLPLADSLRADGWRVDALAAGATSTAALAPHFDQRFDATWSRRLVDPGSFIGTPRRVRELVTSGGYEIVHVHTPIASFVGRWALRRLRARGLRIIYTAHGFHFHDGGGSLTNAAYRSAERAAARWTDYLVTMNAEDFSAARTLGTIDPDRVRFIPGIGVDPAAYQPLPGQREAERSELAIPPDAFVLVMIAEMNANKRHGLVLESLAATHDPRVTLLLVGTGELEPELRERAGSLGIADRVRFLGPRSDVPALLAASDALVLASVREGMPRVVLEAMAAGIPVVATRTRGVIDAVDGPTGDAAGWLVAPTADDLARAIGDAAADPHEAARRGATGQSRIDRTYALPLIVAAYRGLYDEALA